jgi:hypothetical protein
MKDLTAVFIEIDTLIHHIINAKLSEDTVVNPLSGWFNSKKVWLLVMLHISVW